MTIYWLEMNFINELKCTTSNYYYIKENSVAKVYYSVGYFRIRWKKEDINLDHGVLHV